GKGRAGRIVRSKFLGDAALLEIAVEGLDSTLFARVLEEETPFVSAEIGVEIDPGRVLIFNQTAEDDIDGPLKSIN
ncbi:MAG: hypothetical protein ACR2OX_01005, partial [Methyloligellaceae bacterium]